MVLEFNHFKYSDQRKFVFELSMKIFAKEVLLTQVSGFRQCPCVYVCMLYSVQTTILFRINSHQRCYF